tara:strand:+ start:5965 stop:6261 length:297 start_codon:yes stop_codon:yes gene_type:complete
MTINKINPPPLLRKPKAFKGESDVNAYTDQIETILFQMWKRMGGNTDYIAALTNDADSGFNSQAQWLQKQIDGLPIFTVDTSGFTTDLTFITTDKVIA